MDKTANWLAIAGFTALALLIGVCVYFAIQSDNEFKRHCKEDLGGRYDSDTITSQTTGYHMVNGKQVFGSYTTTTTTGKCLGEEGQILEIH